MRFRGHLEVCNEPIVKRPMVLEFQRANGVGDVLDGVRLTMRKIVAWKDLPRRTGARMRRVQNSIEHRVAEIDIARRHVDLGSQNSRTVEKFACPHAAEQIQVLLDAALPERAVFARFGQGATVEPHLLRGLVVNIGLAGPDQILAPGVKSLKVVGGMVEMLSPVKTEPPDIALNRVDIFLLFLGWIRVIEPHVTAAAELLGCAKIQANRLGVPDVKIPIWFRRKAGDDLLDAAGIEITLDDIADEIAARFDRARITSCLCIGYHASSNIT